MMSARSVLPASSAAFTIAVRGASPVVGLFAGGLLVVDLRCCLFMLSFYTMTPAVADELAGVSRQQKTLQPMRGLS